MFVICAGVCRTIFAVCWNAVAFWKIGQTIKKVCRCTPYCSFLKLIFMYLHLGSIFAVGLVNYLVSMNSVFDSHSFKQQNFILINTFLKSDGIHST